MIEFFFIPFSDDLYEQIIPEPFMQTCNCTTMNQQTLNWEEVQGLSWIFIDDE